MEIKKLETGRVRITLTGKELREMNLSYESIDCHMPETQALICALTAVAKAQTGFDPGYRLLAEFFPEGQDGCIVYLSDADDPAQEGSVRKINAPVIYAFEDLNVLISAAVRLFSRCSHRIRKSSLYLCGKEWRLVLYPLDMVENITLSFLDEFAPRCGEGVVAEAALKEHAQQLLEDNAIDLLSAYFG